MNFTACPYIHPQNHSMLATCLFLANAYIFWRGAWVVFWEALAALGHIFVVHPSQDMCVKFKMYSVSAVFKYLSLIRRYLGNKHQSETYPTIIIEGTYAPKRSFHRSGIKIHGPMCEKTRRGIQHVVQQYPSLHHTPRHSPWLKVIVFKAHFVHKAVFQQLYQVCQEEGGFFVGTVTNDPFAETHLTCIGFDDDIVQEVRKYVENVPNLHAASF